MRARCIDNVGMEGILELGKIYEAEETVNKTAIKIKEFCNWLPNISRFEIVEEKEMIKIKKWEDLRGLKNDKHNLIVLNHEIQIWENENLNLCAVFVFKNITQETTLAILKQFGFDVEFIEILKLTEEQKIYVKALKLFGFHWVVQEKYSGNCAFRNKPERGKCNWLDCNDTGFCTDDLGLLESLFPLLKWEDEPLFLDDLDLS